MYNYDNIKTIQDVIHYWRTCVDDATQETPLPTRSAWLVGIHHAQWGNDKIWEEWYDEPLFAELLSKAEALEMDDANDPHAQDNWQKILDLLSELETKYLQFKPTDI